MPETALPSAQDALASLRATGNQFETVPLAPQAMGGVTFVHARHGVQPVMADARVVRATGQFFAADKRLRGAIRAAGGRAHSMQSGADLVDRMFAQPRLIWGVSGFASVGYSCRVEADRLVELYRYFAAHYRPFSVWDGAAGAGVLGINGVLAAEHQIDTGGVTPLQGMSSMAPRTHMLVYGDTYQQREIIVGLLPDILVIDGGGAGAEREGVATLNNNGYVLLLDDPDQSSIPWRTVPEMVRAVDEKRMFVCGQLGDIPMYAERLRVAAEGTAQNLRPARAAAIRQLLTA